MKEIIIEVLTSVACLALASIAYYAAKFIHNKCQQLKQKTDSEALKALIDKIDYIVQLCVEATNQTFVDDKKKQDAFGEEEHGEAFSQTFDSIDMMLTDEDKAKIAEVFGDIPTFIRTSIENYIKNSKTEV